MIQRNQSTLTRPIRAQNGFIRPSDQLRPVSIDNTCKRLDKRVRNVVQETRVRVEIGERNWFQLKTFTPEVGVNKVEDLFIGWGTAVDRGEILDDCLRSFVCRFVNEGLGISVKFGNVYSLQ